jgi:hypothetical protein
VCDCVGGASFGSLGLFGPGHFDKADFVQHLPVGRFLPRANVDHFHQLFVL